MQSSKLLINPLRKYLFRNKVSLTFNSKRASIKVDFCSLNQDKFVRFTTRVAQLIEEASFRFKHLFLALAKSLKEVGKIFEDEAIKPEFLTNSRQKSDSMFVSDWSRQAVFHMVCEKFGLNAVARPKKKESK